MVDAKKVSDLLRKQLELMETLEGRQIGGFALIVPPEGDSIDFVTLGAQSDTKSFYKYLSDKLSAGLEQSQMGGTMPRIR